MRHIATRISSSGHACAAALALVAAAVLSACGGGGDPGAVPPRSGAAPGTGSGGGTVTPPVAADTKVTVALVDGSGNTVTSLSGGQTASLKATVPGPAGKPAAGAIVQFATSAQDLVSFKPETGSALTDANGVA
ncbi:MAG: hypothetical protein V7631_286 [Massilia sp.]|jgi:hypothetical protein